MKAIPETLVLLAIVLVLPQPLLAAVITVNGQTSDYPSCDLVEAIETANSDSPLYGECPAVGARGADTIELEHVKWVILMVLSNYTDGDGVSELTETVVLDGLHSCIH